MNHKKIIVASIVAALILAISCTASYYKTSTDGHQLTLKRNSILEYLHENNNTSFSKELRNDTKKPH
jgi:hypothetical protein